MRKRDKSLFTQLTADPKAGGEDKLLALPAATVGFAKNIYGIAAGSPAEAIRRSAIASTFHKEGRTQEKLEELHGEINEYQRSAEDTKETIGEYLLDRFHADETSLTMTDLTKLEIFITAGFVKMHGMKNCEPTMRRIASGRPDTSQMVQALYRYVTDRAKTPGPDRDVEGRVSRISYIEDGLTAEDLLFEREGAYSAILEFSRLDLFTFMSIVREFCASKKVGVSETGKEFLEEHLLPVAESFKSKRNIPATAPKTRGPGDVTILVKAGDNDRASNVVEFDRIVTSEMPVTEHPESQDREYPLIFRAPESTLRNDARRVLVEWGSAALTAAIKIQKIWDGCPLDKDYVLERADKSVQAFFVAAGKHLYETSLKKFRQRDKDKVKGFIQEELGDLPVTEQLQIVRELRDEIEPDDPERQRAFAIFEKLIEAGAQAAIAIGYRWALSGFPLLVPSHKLAASLMATYMPSEYAPEVELPWKTFAVKVPEGLLPSLEDPVLKESYEVRFIGLSTEDSGQMIVFAGSQDQALLGTWPLESLAELSDPQPIEGVSDDIERARVLLYRLLLQTILEMDEPHSHERTKRERGTHKGVVEDGKYPTSWVFELRRDVKVDLRDWVREYVAKGERSGAGKGAKRAVRVLVRGHRKRQPYGPNSSLRKWIHVQPYWSGPDGAPIAVREHVIKSAEDE